MILFSYTDNQGIILGNGELQGSSFRGPGFPVGMSFPQILGIELKVHSPAQDGVLLSRQSLFCFLLHLQFTLKILQYVYGGVYVWRRKWQPTPVFLPRKSHGRSLSLLGCSPVRSQRVGDDLVAEHIAHFCVLLRLS